MTCCEMSLTACGAGTLLVYSGASRGAQSTGRKRVSWRRGRAEQSGLPEEALHVCSLSPWCRCLMNRGSWASLVASYTILPRQLHNFEASLPFRPSLAPLMAHLDPGAATCTRP